jgi:hypothetical protein
MREIDPMRLQLKYSPTPENAPRFASDIVAAAAKISGVQLDYTADSLKTVDDIIEKMRQDGCTTDQIAETLFGFGCYVGEVLVRQAGGEWQNTAETSMAKIAGFPLIVALGQTNICNPIGKVFKRLRNGEEDSLHYFYQVFAKG